MNTKKFKRFSRAHDEQVLALIKARATECSIPAVAREFGVGISSVQMATNSVRVADLFECGEDPKEVAKHYWEDRK